MTVADPHGNFVDTIRSCYASWMNTPDAGRIRVRWYKVTIEPGIYPLGDYSSSDWDEDPKCYDPEFGEESTTRSPFVDWRDCSPPPWDCPAVGFCGDLDEPPPFNILFIMDASAAPAPQNLLSGTWLLRWGSPCVWNMVSGPTILPTTGGLYSIIDGNRDFLNAQWTSGGPATCFLVDGQPISGVWRDNLHWDGQILVNSPVAGAFPFKGKLIAFGCNPILSEKGKKLLTEGGDILVTE